jgi:hypothetical protein
MRKCETLQFRIYRGILALLSHRGGVMLRRLSVLVGCIAVLAVSAGTASAANDSASCNGILVSSLAAQPGIVAALTKQFHDEFKDAGIPPGAFDAAGAQDHAGSVEACLGG